MRRSVPILLILLAACSQFRVRSNFDPRKDFTHLRTYAWVPLDQADPADQRLLDRYLEKRVRSAVESELGAKGYKPVDAGTPDFLVNYRLTTEASDSARGRAVPWGTWESGDTVNRESYDVGTLLIGISDGHSHRLVWIGAAQTRLLSNASLEKRAERAEEAVQQILASFPPKPGSDAVH